MSFRDFWKWLDGIRSATEAPDEPEPEPDEEDDEIVFRWPPNPVLDPPCIGDEKGSIELNIYHLGNLKAAETVARYARVSLCHAWGDKYLIEVNVVSEPVSDYSLSGPNDLERWYDVVTKRRDRARDGNLLIHDGPSMSVAVDHAAIAGHAELITEHLYGKPVRQHGSSRGHRQMGKALHELFHQIGLDHEDGGVRVFTGNVRAVTPMQASYTDTGKWTPLLHPRAIEAGPGKF